MTRDEHRAKCVKAMQEAATRYGLYIDWFAAFDSLHGIARVVPIEATEEILDAVYDHNAPECSPTDYDWECMARAGDLTNPPEGKP